MYFPKSVVSLKFYGIKIVVTAFSWNENVWGFYELLNSPKIENCDFFKMCIQSL